MPVKKLTLFINILLMLTLAYAHNAPAAEEYQTTCLDTTPSHSDGPVLDKGYPPKYTVEDVTDLSGTGAERHRTWDSCFTLDFSYIHGGTLRTSVKSRYRQWMTHKLASWEDQFGMTGCVGCGRCITWCPVGIDITEEVEHIREKKTI